MRGVSALPWGFYKAEVTDAQHRTPDDLRVRFTVELTVTDGAHRGQRVRDEVVLNVTNPTSVAFFNSRMAAFGLDRQLFASLADQPNQEDAICDALIGRRVVIAVDAQRTSHGLATSARLT
jgi:hypothetical protein